MGFICLGAMRRTTRTCDALEASDDSKRQGQDRCVFFTMAFDRKKLARIPRRGILLFEF